MDPNKYIAGKLYDAAECMTYDGDLVFFKRFKRLNFYNLLTLQMRLSKLDADLANNVILGTGDTVDDISTQIRDTLKQYNKALLVQLQISKAQSPAPRSLETVRDFLNHMRNEVAVHELSLDKDDVNVLDFVAGVQVEKSWSHKFIDSRSVLRKVFQKPSPNKNLMIYSEDGVRRSVRLFVPLLFSIFLMVPIMIMSLYKDNSTQLGVLIGFVFCTSATVCLATKAKDWEILTVTAGYCAILVVFLGQNQTVQIT